MNKKIHSNSLTFRTILDELKRDYTPFQGEVEKSRTPKSLIDAIEKARTEGRNPVISEVKYSSPTKKKIREGIKVESIVRAMEKGGACAISVLTEEKYFDGKLENLKKARTITDLPLLRKDFIFHPSQIPESYHHGADSLLLIASFYAADKLKKMISESRRFGMEPLVEIHTAEDIETAERAGAKLYAINNRDKDTLKIDLERTSELAPLINGVKVSASGIETAEHLKRVLRYADAALIGSSIMASPDITSKVREFTEARI